jgi:hypothetical protein
LLDAERTSVETGHPVEVRPTSARVG